MAEKKYGCCLVQLIVGIILIIVSSLVTSLFPRFFDEEKELSYLIDNPIIYLDQEIIRDLDVEIDDEAVSSIYGYKIYIWNSGDIPLKNVPVCITFKNIEKDFKIFRVQHKTRPKHEFGKIEEINLDNGDKRFIYEILNPKYKDEITLLTNNKVLIEVYSNAEGTDIVNFQKDKQIKYLFSQVNNETFILCSFTVFIIGLFAFILGFILGTFFGGLITGLIIAFFQEVKENTELETKIKTFIKGFSNLIKSLGKEKKEKKPRQKKSDNKS